ncbi:hypothetical protein FOA52_001790 [Chlamydomonas sp. UWO 241]|nr:hypothetical protein FOA52_001790 [Chlamydomonas sp. UWO 241]
MGTGSEPCPELTIPARGLPEDMSDEEEGSTSGEEDDEEGEEEDDDDEEEWERLEHEHSREGRDHEQAARGRARTPGAAPSWRSALLMLLVLAACVLSYYGILVARGGQLPFHEHMVADATGGQCNVRDLRDLTTQLAEGQAHTSARLDALVCSVGVLQGAVAELERRAGLVAGCPLSALEAAHGGRVPAVVAAHSPLADESASAIDSASDRIARWWRSAASLLHAHGADAVTFVSPAARFLSASPLPPALAAWLDGGGGGLAVAGGRSAAAQRPWWCPALGRCSIRLRGAPSPVVNFTLVCDAAAQSNATVTVANRTVSVTAVTLLRADSAESTPTARWPRAFRLWRLSTTTLPGNTGERVWTLVSQWEPPTPWQPAGASCATHVLPTPLSVECPGGALALEGVTDPADYHPDYYFPAVLLHSAG